MAQEYAAEEKIAARLARVAGKAIMDIYASPFDVRYKGPGDPVTDADLRAQDLIVEGLSREFPSDGIVSEELPVSPDARRKPRVWYVDPLDGTGEFVARRGEFCVMIGLLEHGLPKLGIIYRPVDGVLYTGLRDEGAWRTVGAERKQTWVSTSAPPHVVRLAVSQSHRHSLIDRVTAALKSGGSVKEILCRSVGVKITLLLSGEADAYIEPSTYTSKWDVCAAEAILRGAG